MAVENYKKWKKNHIRLKNEFPNDVLIMDLEDGWEPLSSFIGFKAPDIDFPRLNTYKLKENTCAGFCGCEHEIAYCEQYDSEYCPVCLEWCDDVCGEENCLICGARPNIPINLGAD